MTFNTICISSGHGKHVRGAAGPKPWGLDEVDEARQVVNQVAEDLRERGVEVHVFHDDVSKSQNENLNRIVDWHNSQFRDIDISTHFNAFESTSKPMGVEVLYVTQQQLAAQVSAAIAAATGLPNRGPKKRTDLFFLNRTNEPAILIETCFVDSTVDADVYRRKFTEICAVIADVLGGPRDQEEVPPPEGEVSTPDRPPLVFPVNQSGITATVFGGAADPNNSAYAPYGKITDTVLGVALPDRFEGDRPRVHVFNPSNGKQVFCEIVDIGPWETNDPYWDTGTRPKAESGVDSKGRTTNGAGIDLTPAAARALGVEGKAVVSWCFVRMPPSDDV